MTVTCLVCGLLTYRVAQRISPDLSNEEGPVLPTDDWVEKELCKSATGWIEINQGCLVSLHLWPLAFSMHHLVFRTSFFRRECRSVWS